jgi:hypothetical protein
MLNQRELLRSCFSLYLAHRAATACLALSLRSSGVMLAARARPPFLAPLSPSATAAGFFFFGLGMSGIIRARLRTSQPPSLTYTCPRTYNLGARRKAQTALTAWALIENQERDCSH